MLLHSVFSAVAEKDDAVGHGVAPFRPFCALVGGHAGPDEIDVVSEETERKRPGEQGEKAYACRPKTANVKIDGGIGKEVVAFGTEICLPA